MTHSVTSFPITTGLNNWGVIISFVVNEWWTENTYRLSFTENNELNFNLDDDDDDPIITNLVLAHESANSRWRIDVTATDISSGIYKLDAQVTLTRSGTGAIQESPLTHLASPAGDSPYTHTFYFNEASIPSGYKTDGYRIAYFTRGIVQESTG